MRPAAAGPAVAALLLLTGAGCGGRAADAPPDVTLVVVDTLRADHLGAYGYERPTSPRLDGLAAEGARFDAAWGAAPWTLPSIMSILTGRYPSTHRVENDGLRLAAGVPTLAATLKTRGYATAGFVSHVYVTAPFGFDRGFDRFEDFGLTQSGYRPEARMEPTADRVTDAALEWARRAGSGPLFLFVHYFDPHWPYEPPERVRALFPSAYSGPLDAGYDSISRFQDEATPIPEDYRRFLVDRYDGEIRFTDEQIGRLRDGLRAARPGRRSWFVVTGDHGEEFKEHGSMGHGRQMYEEVLHVPLVVDGPGVPAGRRVATPVSGVDVLPTIAEIAGAAVPAGVEGRSFLKAAAGPVAADAEAAGSGAAPPPDGPSRPLYSETERLGAFRRAVRLGPLKLIHSMDEDRSLLFDLQADPRETRDLATTRPDDRRRLMAALFAVNDLLSGAWNLRWSGDGRPHRFQGRITTTGVFRTIVPLFEGGAAYRMESERALEFSEPSASGDGGLTFTTTPYEARVTFHLTLDGRAAPDAVVLGGSAARPRTMPFTLDGSPGAAAAFAPPAAGALRGPGFRMWRTPPAAPDQPVVLDDETRQRLRSLGYVQ